MAATVAAGRAAQNRAMPLSALVLVLIAAVLHALWNIAAKKAGGDQRFVLLSSALMALLWLPLGMWFAWRELPGWGVTEWVVIFASAGVHLAYYRTLLAGYRTADLTVVYPLARGSGPLVTTLAAVLLLGETLTAFGIAGVLAVCGGVFLIAGGPALLQGLRRQGHDPVAQARLRAGLRWGLATGALIACYSVIDGYAIKVLAMSPVLYDWLNNVLRVLLQLPGYARDPAAYRTAWRLQWRHALVVGTLGPAAYICVLTALQQAPLSLVAPARECSMLVAALLGGHLLGEGDRRARLLGAACITLGVLLLATG
jgi:drug/metabolite transporter (DMT)-like permease